MDWTHLLVGVSSFVLGGWWVWKPAYELGETTGYMKGQHITYLQVANTASNDMNYLLRDSQGRKVIVHAELQETP